MKPPHNTFQTNGFGKIAPWVDLVNSEEWNGFGKLTDQLANPRWLGSFLKHWDLYPVAANRVPRRELERLRRLLRNAAERLAAGGSLGGGELTKLNQALNVPAGTARVSAAPVRCKNKKPDEGIFPVARLAGS